MVLESLVERFKRCEGDVILQVKNELDDISQVALRNSKCIWLTRFDSGVHGRCQISTYSLNSSPLHDSSEIGKLLLPDTPIDDSAKHAIYIIYHLHENRYGL